MNQAPMTLILGDGVKLDKGLDKCECGAQILVKSEFPGVRWCALTRVRLDAKACPATAEAIGYVIGKDYAFCPRCHYRYKERNENYDVSDGAVIMFKPMGFYCTDCNDAHGFCQDSVDAIIEACGLKAGFSQDDLDGARQEGVEEGEQNFEDNHECNHDDCYSYDSARELADGKVDEIAKRFHDHWDEMPAPAIKEAIDKLDWRDRVLESDVDDVIAIVHDALVDWYGDTGKNRLIP